MAVNRVLDDASSEGLKILMAGVSIQAGTLPRRQCWGYLHSEPELTQTLGGTLRYRDFMAIQRVDEKDDLRAMIARGTVRRNDNRAKGFDHFVQSFLSSRARRGGDLVPRVLAVVTAPMHISHGARAAQRLPPAAKVERVEVMFREVWYDGARLHLLREVKVRDIPMVGSSSAARD